MGMNKNEKIMVMATAVGTVMLTAVLVRRWGRMNERRRWKQARRGILHNFAKECATPVAKLWAVAADMEEYLSLQKPADGSSNLVSSTGEEKKGTYYGVNLRGKDFIVVRARLAGKTEPVSDIIRQDFSLPQHLTSASSQDICDFIAVELSKFVAMYPEEEGQKDEEIKLGFTVFHPIDQTQTTSASAVQHKSVSVDDKDKEEILNEMNRALEKYGLKFHVHEMVDHAIGDLAGGRYYNKDTVAAVTLGMGTNAAYVQQVAEAPGGNIKVTESDETIINTNWGDFKSTHLSLTEFDSCLDAESLNPRSKIFEKLVSGTYLGEIVRRVLLTMAEETAIFGKDVPPKLMVPYLLSSPDMAAMHQDTSEEREVIDEKLKEIFEVTNSTVEVRELVAETCDVVVERGARLAGAGIVGILKKLERIEKKKSVVVVGGGLYEHYRVFRNYLHSSIWEMLGQDLSKNIAVEHCHGGSGAGALFLAAR